MPLWFDTIANFVEFQDEVSDWLREKMPRHVLGWQKKIWREVVKKVVNRTPYRTGHARANWQVTKTVFSSRLFPVKVDTSPGGQDTVAKLWAVLDTYKAFDMVFISNNVPYIGFLEDGTSSQAPNGIIASTLMEVRTKYDSFRTDDED